MKKNTGKSIIIWVICIAIALIASYALFSSSSQKEVAYSQVVNDFKSGQVTEFVVNSENVLIYKLSTGTIYRHSLRDVSIFYADLGDLISEQLSAGTLTSYDYESTTLPWWVSLLPYVVVILLFVVFWWIFIAKTSNGGAGGGFAGRMNSFGKARTKLGSDERVKVSFADVAGADEEKAELQEIVDFLKNPKKYSALGARIPRGVLLVGSPGTGKTLLAKAVAGESGVPFYSISGSDFVEMYVGVGASRVRDLFETAKKTAPCIIFIDEIDAVGRHRGSGLGGSHDEREQTLNQMLVEMDGFGANEGVIVMAATNRPDILDPALLRPGRFDRQITVSLPDIKGRAAILKVHSKNKPLGSDVNFDTVAQSTAGMTGADLNNILNEAALTAARKKKNVINMDDIEEAVMKEIVGPNKRSRVLTEKEKRNTAYHEAGHAIVSHELPSTDPVYAISIIPSGRALGYTVNLPTEDKLSYYKHEMLDMITMMLGGRAAEEIISGDNVSSGASNDIERASKLARAMVTKYGMSTALGPIQYGNENEEVFLGRDFGTTKSYSESIADQIDEEVHKIITEAYQHALSILREKSDILDFVSNYLVKHESMDGDQFEKCFEEGVTEEQIENVKNEKEAAKAAERAELAQKEKEKKSEKVVKETVKGTATTSGDDEDFS